MKKEGLFGGFILIALLIVSCSQDPLAGKAVSTPVTHCEKIQEGRVLAVDFTGAGDYDTYTDQCNGNLLLENVCEQTGSSFSISRRSVTCPNGCADGACLVAPPAPIVQPQPVTVPATAAGGIINQVSMEDSTFLPDPMEIMVGESIEWVNMDDVAHTVTFDELEVDEVVPPQGRTSVSFTEPGEFTYFCQFHPEMKGTIIVLGEELLNEEPLLPES